MTTVKNMVVGRGVIGRSVQDKVKGPFGPRVSMYADLYKRETYRSKKEPRVSRPYRTKNLAWTGMNAFYRNRFYEVDRWYKARIHRPRLIPNLHLIDADDFSSSLQERLEELKRKEMESEERQPIDVGLRYDKEHLDGKQSTNGNKLLEPLARHHKLIVDIEAVEDVQHGSGQSHWIEQRMKLASHHGIFRDLFHQDAYFYPVVSLDISFEYTQDAQARQQGQTSQSETLLAPVFFGNTVKPQEAMNQPSVSFKVPSPEEKDTLWTLVAVNPDGNPFQENTDILHWMVSNIPWEGSVGEGEEVVEYLQPLPFHGSGWHRFVFLLFRQDKGRVDLTHLHLDNTWNLQNRSFSTPKFYKKLEDELTPAGVAYFQCEWDQSVQKTLHNKLGMEQPMYKFEFPAPEHAKQEPFPEKSVAFHTYLDKYRSAQDVEEEILRKRLKRVRPFKKDPERLKYPNIFWYEDKANMEPWRHVEKQRENLQIGKYKGIFENRIE